MVIKLIHPEGIFKLNSISKVGAKPEKYIFFEQLHFEFMKFNELKYISDATISSLYIFMFDYIFLNCELNWNWNPNKHATD